MSVYILFVFFKVAWVGLQYVILAFPCHHSFKKQVIIHQSEITDMAINIYISKLQKVRKKANNRNQYNQVPHLIQDITLEVDKNTRKHHIKESKEVSPLLAGDHKVSMIDMKHNNKIDQQKKHFLGMVSKNFFTGWLKRVLWYQPPLISDVDQDK